MYIGVSACKVSKCRLCSSGTPNKCERCDVGYVVDDGSCEGKFLVTKYVLILIQHTQATWISYMIVYEKALKFISVVMEIFRLSIV